MPPHLHPRSRTTTSLFTTTLLFSFLVVATPHFLPCPVDPRTLADSDPRRRRRVATQEDADGLSEERRKLESEEWRAPSRECPVPKPGGLIGTVLGIRKVEGEEKGRGQVTRQIERARWRRKPEDGE